MTVFSFLIYFLTALLVAIFIWLLENFGFLGVTISALFKGVFLVKF